MSVHLLAGQLRIQLGYTHITLNNSFPSYMIRVYFKFFHRFSLYFFPLHVVSFYEKTDNPLLSYIRMRKEKQIKDYVYLDRSIDWLNFIHFRVNRLLS